MGYYDYICRNKNGDLVIFKLQWNPPRRGNEFWIGNEWINLGAYEIANIVKDDETLNLYKHLTWDHDPIILINNNRYE